MTTSKRMLTEYLGKLPEIRLSRAAWVVTALALVAAVVYLAVEYDAGWVAIGFGLMPDIGLLAGLSKEIEKGRLKPRAVPLYNALHRLVGPVVMLILATTDLTGDWGFVAGLAWAAHIAVDRALGYGLRTPEGYVRD